MEKSFRAEFISESISRLEENTPKIQKCLDALSEAEVWQRPNPSTNSVANLILHLCGNMGQYILSSLGEVEDTRDRDAEFSMTGGFTKAALMDKLQSTVAACAEVIRSQKNSDLTDFCERKRSVQGFSLTAIGIIIHVIEHYSYHTGQIIFWTKLLKDKDLGFYANTNLNVKNKI